MGTRTGRIIARLFEPVSAATSRLQSQEVGRQHSLPNSHGRPVIALSIALPLAVSVAVFMIVFAWPGGMAFAGDVEGKVVFKAKDGKSGDLGKPPLRNRGLLERIENPLRPIRKFNPRPYVVVVLDGGPVDDEAKKAPEAKVRYDLIGQSFAQPLFPVVVQSRVELVNRTAHPAVLFTPEHAYFEEPITLRPRGMEEFKITKEHETVVIRSQDSSHLEGRVVAFPHRYFALLDRRGRFEIKGVPEGNWNVRVWYRDGWLEGVEQTIEVGKRKTAVDLNIPPSAVRAAKK